MTGFHSKTVGRIVLAVAAMIAACGLASPSDQNTVSAAMSSRDFRLGAMWKQYVATWRAHDPISGDLELILSPDLTVVFREKGPETQGGEKAEEILSCTVTPSSIHPWDLRCKLDGRMFSPGFGNVRLEAVDCDHLVFKITSSMLNLSLTFTRADKTTGRSPCTDGGPYAGLRSIRLDNIRMAQRGALPGGSSTPLWIRGFPGLFALWKENPHLLLVAELDVDAEHLTVDGGAVGLAEAENTLTQRIMDALPENDPRELFIWVRPARDARYGLVFDALAVAVEMARDHGIPQRNVLLGDPEIVREMWWFSTAGGS